MAFQMRSHNCVFQKRDLDCLDPVGSYGKETVKFGVTPCVFEEPHTYDFGVGAGFYLNATTDKYKTHYNMLLG